MSHARAIVVLNLKSVAVKEHINMTLFQNGMDG